MVLLCSIDQSNRKSWWGYFDRPFMEIYKQGLFLSWKQISRSYRKNINVLHTKMQGYFSKFKYRNFKKPWKSIKVTPFHTSKISIMNFEFENSISSSLFLDVCLEKPEIDFLFFHIIVFTLASLRQQNKQD